MFGYYSKLSSEVYDLDKYVGLSFGDVEFYADRLKGCEGKILEAAVGTGRMLIPLAKQGFKLEGFDLSEEMLAICKKNCEQHGVVSKLSIDAMESFSRQPDYAAIIIPAGSFLLVADRQKSVQALKNFHHHLKPGGKLILDLFLPEDFETGRVSTREFKTRDQALITLESKVVDVNFLEQTIKTHHRYEKWRQGKLEQTELEHFPLRWYGIEEFKLLLEKLGFSEIIISSDYQHGIYPDNKAQTISFEAIASK